MIRKNIFFHWAGVFFLAVFIVSQSQYKSSNDDSKYYTDLVVRYQHENWQNILSPLWGVNYYSYAPTAYMRDQLPGQLILGVGVSKLGIPASQALHVLGMVFQILSILLLVKVAEQFGEVDKARCLYYGLLLTPMAFSYNLRANHELGVMFFCFLSLYAGLKLEKSLGWSLISALASVMLLMIKGPFFIFGLILFTIGFYFSPKKAKLWTLVFSLFLSGLSILLVGYLYESFFIKVTGQSFFLEFYKIQIQQRAMTNTHAHSFLIQKLLNFKYYFVNYFSYSLPWCLLVLISIVKNRKDEKMMKDLKSFITSPISLCLLTAAFVFCFMFSMSDRTASRYIFPAYYLFSAWSVLLLLHLSKVFQNFHQKTYLQIDQL